MMRSFVRGCPAMYEVRDRNLKNHSYVHLYGIVASREHRNFGNIGIGAKPVYTICYNGIAAVVSAAGDGTTSDPAAKRQHYDAQNRVRSQVPILPMAYRENLSSSDVKRILTARYTHLKVQLACLSNDVMCARRRNANMTSGWGDAERIACFQGRRAPYRRLVAEFNAKNISEDPPLICFILERFIDPS